MMTRTVFVLCKDYHSEGLAEPFIVYQSEAEAIAAKEMLSSFDAGCTKIIEAEYRTSPKEQTP